MGDLTKNLSRSEFDCKCKKENCETPEISMKLVELLQETVDYFAEERGESLWIRITSGLRCPEHNKLVGGSPRSQHLKGLAADVRLKNVQPLLVFNLISQWFQVSHGVGNYTTFTHIDVRKSRARW